MGSESGASSMTGGTCVAIDIVFTGGTALRNLPVTDQYGNTLTSVNECNHLQPDQWNYVTADLSRASRARQSAVSMSATTNPALTATMEARWTTSH